MDFDWDEAKSEATFRARGFDFAYASRVFDGARVVVLEEQVRSGEARTKVIGEVEANLLVIVFTMRAETCRIISARLASRKE